MVTILVVYGFSYLLRFVWDEVIRETLLEKTDDVFLFYLVFDVVGYAEGLSLAALLLFHKSNFKLKKCKLEI